MQAVFIPYSEEFLQELGAIGELVPFQLDYECLRMKDGTYDFTTLAPVTLAHDDREAA